MSTEMAAWSIYVSIAVYVTNLLIINYECDLFVETETSFGCLVKPSSILVSPAKPRKFEMIIKNNDIKIGKENGE